MPNTRASTRLAAKRKLGGSEYESEGTATSSGDSVNINSLRHVRKNIRAEEEMSVMDNLKEVNRGVEKLYTRIQSLEQENEILRSQLVQAQQNVPGGSGRNLGSRGKVSRHQIRSLERRIGVLKAAREKDRYIIEKFQEKEVARDAKELTADLDGVVPTQGEANLGDEAIRFLRSVCNTIGMNTLAEGEECAICMEVMTVEKCYSLPCQHPVCGGCFERLGDGSNTLTDERVQFPHCRKVYPRDECEVITHTAVQQWDILLEISQEWAAKDDAGEVGVDAEDEDDELEDDGSVAVANSPCVPESHGETTDPDPEVSTAVNDTKPATYNNLPSPLKRLAELAEQQALRQRI